MADNWYYGRKGQQHGPITEAQLRQLVVSGQLQPTDVVWKKGMAQWVKANQIKGLFPAPSKPVHQAASAAVAPKAIPGQGTPRPSLPKKQEAGCDVERLIAPGPSTTAVPQLDQPTIIDEPQHSRRSSPRSASTLQGASFDLEDWAASTETSHPTRHGTATHARSKSSFSTKQKLVIGIGAWFGLGLLSLIILAALGHSGSRGSRQSERWNAGNESDTTSATEWQSSGSSQKITEDYLPHKVGARCHYHVHGDVLDIRFTYIFRDNGVFNIDTTSLNGRFAGNRRKTEQRRVSGNFVEVSLTQETSEVEWHPVLKLGATVGDQWERALNGATLRYKVTSFGKLKLKTDGRERQTVTITETMSEQPPMENHCVYAKGIGLVTKECYQGSQLVSTWTLNDECVQANLTESEEAFYK